MVVLVPEFKDSTDRFTRLLHVFRAAKSGLAVIEVAARRIATTISCRRGIRIALITAAANHPQPAGYGHGWTRIKLHSARGPFPGVADHVDSSVGRGAFATANIHQTLGVFPGVCQTLLPIVPPGVSPAIGATRRKLPFFF